MRSLSASVFVRLTEFVLAGYATTRPTVEPIADVTVGTGCVRQNQNMSNDCVIAASVLVPMWNRNQGNIISARAQVDETINEVARVGNDFVNRLATTFATYPAARKRTEKYEATILPKAKQSYQSSLKAYQGSQFEYLRVLQAPRAVAGALLEYFCSLGEMSRAASQIDGLMLENYWPFAPAVPIAPPPERKLP